MTFESLLARSAPQCSLLDSSVLQEVPSVFEFEIALRALNAMKSPGLDGIGAEIYQAGVANTAKRAFPLLLKMFVRQQGIVEFTGGWLVPLFKGKGSAAHMPGYRAILLEPTMARAISKAWRPWLAKGVEKAAQPLQYGGRRGLAIEPLHLSRLWQINAKKGRSLALIFVDKSAFYAVTTAMIAGFDGSHDGLVAIFQRMGLPATALEEFISNVGSGDAIYRHTNSALVISWFISPSKYNHKYHTLLLL